MSLKKLGVALLAVFVLGAIAANSAFAANEWRSENEKGAWYVSGSKLAEGTSPVLSTTAVGTQKLNTTVAGTALELTASGVTCVTCSIKNAGTTASASGALKFTGVAVAKPAGCSTTSTIETKALTAVLGMNKLGTIATMKFAPASGATFTTVELTGIECPIAGLYKVTGTAYAQATLKTGEFAVNQEITLSKAIQESAGEATSLKFGENSAILTGAVKGTLASSPSWGGKES